MLPSTLRQFVNAFHVGQLGLQQKQGRTSTFTVPPDGVNLNALDIKLLSTSPKRISSPTIIKLLTSFCTRKFKLTSLLTACTLNR
mmetsp:Transcript_18102/g.34587  ORF Transcript_18102/g.34587 Transcript_18102/m.34587 type:complete len:85 (+) Transcript_18102:1287-1541(+)